jgi:hypothetical protein
LNKYYIKDENKYTFKIWRYTFKAWSSHLDNDL